MRPLPLLASLLIPLGTGLAAPPPGQAQLLRLLLGDPNFYGAIEDQPGWWDRRWRGWPQDALVSPRPTLVTPFQGYRRQAPLYLRVPPGHRRNWARHCRRYNACGRPVYFVRDDWYRNFYAPRYRRTYWDQRRRRRENRRDDRRDWRRDQRRDWRRDQRWDGRRERWDDLPAWRREQLRERRDEQREWRRERSDDAQDLLREMWRR